MTEATVIGLVGGGVALLFGVIGFRLLMSSLPIAPGDVATLGIDRGFLLVTLVLGVGTGALVGLIAALAFPAKSRQQDGGQVGRGAVRTSMVQNGLVVSQVALTVLLVAGAGVMVRSVGELSMIETGVSPGQAVVLDVVAGAGDYPEDVRSGLYADVREWVASLPQTASVGLSQKLPLRGRGWTTSVQIPGAPDDPMFVPIRFITPGYFEALGIPLVSGRAPHQLLDGAQGPSAAWVNEALSTKMWPAEDPAGRRSVAAWGADRDVVGVVGNVAEGNLTDALEPAIYVMIEQNPRFLGFAVVARPMPGAGGRYAAQVAGLIREKEPRLAVRRMSTFEDVEQAAQGDTLMVMRLLVLLGGVALLVGAVGVHGVVSQWVNGRIRAWAVSIALGATARTVLVAVLLRSVSLTATGVVVGLLLFAGTGRALESFVFGVARTDSVSLVVTASVVVATGVLAAAVPAYRAVRTDPVSLLRNQ